MIQVKNISKIYNGKIVLDNISLEVHKGDRIVIIGPSGSGKSTLLRCVNLLETPSRGEVWLDGKRISNIDITLYDELKGLSSSALKTKVKILDSNDKLDLDLARIKMGMVFQHFNLFNNLSVLDNLTLAPIKLKKLHKDEAINQALKLLEQIGLSNKKDDYPAVLSGGQKQRVAIARALMNKPEVLLFDEPTSALDPEMVGEVLDLIKKLADNGMTMVCVTHEMNFAKDIASRGIFMEHGKIVEESNEGFFKDVKNERLSYFLRHIRY